MGPGKDTHGTLGPLRRKAVGGPINAHEAVVQDFTYALVVVVSNGLSLDRAQEHVVNTRLGLDRSLFEKL